MTRGAFGKRISEQIPRLRRYAHSLTRDPDRADDLVQDCLARALDRAHLWRADSDLRAWLFTIMHNLYVNALKRDRRWSEAPIEMQQLHELPSRVATGGPEGAIRLHELERGLDELPPDQREVLMLVCLEEMSYQEVSEVLGVPVGTVMSRLHRARERMRRWRSGERKPNIRMVK